MLNPLVPFAGFAQQGIFTIYFLPFLAAIVIPLPLIISSVTGVLVYRRQPAERPDAKIEGCLIGVITFLLVLALECGLIEVLTRSWVIY